MDVYVVGANSQGQSGLYLLALTGNDKAISGRANVGKKNCCTRFEE